MLRKTVFGARGRLSTDLDFTARTEISRDDVMTMMLDALEAIRFDLDSSRSGKCAGRISQRVARMRAQWLPRPAAALPAGQGVDRCGHCNVIGCRAMP
jgi:predicted nucleotidyltransferase component of viral defense system